MGQRQGSKTIVNIFSLLVVVLSGLLPLSLSLSPLIRRTLFSPSRTSSSLSSLPYVLVREGKVVYHSERRKPSSKRLKSTATEVPIPLAISLFSDSSHFSFVRDKRSARVGSCKMSSEGMRPQTGLFSRLLGLKARDIRFTFTLAALSVAPPCIHLVLPCWHACPVP